MQGQFSQLGVSVKVDNSKLVILNDYVVCKSGEPLTANQAQMTVSFVNLIKIQKHLGINLDEFKIDIMGYVITKTGEFKDLSSNYEDVKMD